MIKLTGIADEAGASLDVQIQAHQELGWGSIESRVVELDGVKRNLHEIPDAVFDKVVAHLEEKGMKVSGFGSLIGNWAKKITDDFAITESEIGRAIPRMQRLGTKLIRVMSYAVCKTDGKDDAEQFAPERIRRMNEVHNRFSDAGLTVVHENCMNWGGMSPTYVQRMAEAVPGMKWVFDTGNPVFIDDRDRPGMKQDSWQMYQAIKPFMAHVHVKDGIW
ncbi:MAG: sugar phosphate isomerase/epimerase family protein, partial [Prosthecobacter sp.]